MLFNPEVRHRYGRCVAWPKPPVELGHDAQIVRFPPRCIWLMREAEGGWLVLCGAHGWTHGSRQAATTDAIWLSENCALPIRVRR